VSPHDTWVQVRLQISWHEDFSLKAKIISLEEVTYVDE
jgi:hypothetical protein